MEKEEVLRKAQCHQDDEYKNKVVIDSKGKGMSAMFICLGFIALYYYWMYPGINIRIFQSEVPLSILLFFPTQLGCCIENLYRYTQLHEKKRFVYGMFWLSLILMVCCKLLVDCI